MTGCQASQQIQAAPAGSVAASARAHTQHHAQPEAVPAGRPAGRLAGRPAGPADGGGGGDTGDGVPDDGAGDADDDDDDEEDAGFRQYYAVSRHQRAFIKYDPRHWMGNWFLMAQSKSSALFKFFCTATSDAMFEEREGERGRVKEHLRKIFKQLDVVDTARWGNLAPAGQAAERGRVDGLIARVPRAYWRSHCKATIPPPERLARRLLMVYYFFKDMVSLTLALT